MTNMSLRSITRPGPQAPQPSWTLLCVSVGYAMVIIDTTAVNVALPAIGNDLGAHVAALQWVLDSYVLTFASLLILGGSIGDVFGTARAFRLGIFLFTTASVGCAAAPTATVLIISRILQGVGAAMLAPACLALIAAAYPDAIRRARAVAVFVTVAGSPQAFGPVLGGAVVDALGWRAIFWINVPVGAATLAMATVRRSSSPATDERQSIAWTGHLAICVALLSSTALIIEAPTHGIISAPIVAAGTGLVAAVAILVRHQRRHPAPALSRRVIGSRSALGFIGVGLLLFAGYYGLTFVVTLELQERIGLSTMDTGLVLLAAALPIFGLPIPSRPIIARIGSRRTLLIGMTTAALGATVFAFHVTDDPAIRTAALLLLGSGVGLSVSPQIVAVLDAVPPAAAAQASALLNAARQFGTVLGVALIGAIYSATGRHVVAYATAAAILALGTVVTVAAMLGRRSNCMHERQNG